MLGFTLSKLNLLILVTALFAIISFFMLSLSDIMVGTLAQELVNDAGITVFSLVKGELLCRKPSITIPESIEYFGGLMPTRKFYYVMNIKRFPETPVEEGINTMIFQVASRKDKKNIIATTSVDLNARILLYDWDPVTDLFSEAASLEIDPESAGIGTKDSIVFVKEVFEGKNYLHIIACSSSAGLCERNLGRAACWLKECSSNARESSCFPKAEDCATKVRCGVVN